MAASETATRTRDMPEWKCHVVDDDLFCPHSLQLADFTGDGRLDIFVGEMELGENKSPTHSVYSNQGTFEETVIARDRPTHEAKAVDMNGDGRMDIVGKSSGPSRHVDLWLNTISQRDIENESVGSDAGQPAISSKGRLRFSDRPLRSNRSIETLQIRDAYEIDGESSTQ